MTTATDAIDGYLAGLPEAQRTALSELRATIAAAAPRAEEGFSYGTPAFRYRGRPLVSYGAAKRHCSFYPMNPALIEAHRAELSAFDTAKGTIRFTPERSLPADLVTSIVRERQAELDGAASQKRVG